MAESKPEQLAEALNTFLRGCPDAEAAAVVSFDGLTIADALPEDMADDHVAAMSATLLSLGEQASRGLGRGELREVSVTAEAGCVVLMSAEDEALLVAVAGAEAKLGLVLYEMRRAAKEIGEILEARLALPDDHGEAAGCGAFEAPSTAGNGTNGQAPPSDDARRFQPPRARRDPFAGAELEEPSYVISGGRYHRSPSPAACR